MYVPFGAACSEPNSATPMSAARIAAQNARVRRVGRRFFRGNRILDSIDVALGGSSLGAVPGAVTPIGGAPGSGIGGRGGSGPGVSVLGGGSNGDGSGIRCVAPRVMPTETVFAVPAPPPTMGAFTPPPPPVRPVPTPPAVPLAPPRPAPAPNWPSQQECMSGNICLDLLNGCVGNDQVTQAQQVACTFSNYGGNARNLYPDVLLHLPVPHPFFGTPTPNPTPATSMPPYPDRTEYLARIAEINRSVGLSGLPAGTSTAGMLAAAAAAGLALWWTTKKKGRG